MPKAVKAISSRILALDLMRGWFLIAILLDHLQYFPNGLDILTGRGQLYVSAAEGFFLISGIVLGIVRGRKLLDKPFRVAATLLLKRGVQLYITAVLLFFIFTFMGWLFIDNPGIKPGIRPIDQNFWEIIHGAFTLNYIYGWADYLRLYAVFLIASPLVIWLLRKKLWYVALVGSVYVWMLFDSSTLETDELSQIFSWQLIFFGGMILGYYLEPIRAWWRSLPLLLKRTIVVSSLGITAITALANYLFIVHGDLVFSQQSILSIKETLEPYLSKERLPIPRILLFLVWFTAGFWLFRRFEDWIVQQLGWLLLPLGTHSLYVYTIQAFVIYIAHLFVPQATAFWPLNLVLSLACLGVVIVAVRYKFLMKIIPN
ncbi:MAG: OpgC domain-containing protein [Candidatus Saccharimonas sp.]